MKQPQYLEFELDGTKYRVGRINAFDQAAIAFKLGNFLPSIGRFWVYLQEHESGLNVASMDPAVLQIIGKAMADLPSEDLQFVLNKLCGVVEKQEGPGWMFIATRDRGLIYPLDLRDLIAVCARVIEHNIWSFMPALGLKFPGQAAS